MEGLQPVQSAPVSRTPVPSKLAGVKVMELSRLSQRTSAVFPS